MKLDIIMQTEDVNLKKIIENEMELLPKKMYIFAGTVKESGFNILEENIIYTNVKLHMYMGIDKKNTTKSLLENILTYTDELYVYNNNDLRELEGCTIIFEKDKRACMYVTSSKISENSFLEDLVVISKIDYDLTDETDKREYKEKLKQLVAMKDLGFNKISTKDIQKLIDDKVIFSNKQYEHNVKSIAELLGKTEDKKEEVKVKSDEDINGAEFDIPSVNIDVSSDDFEIDVSGVIDTKPEKEVIENIKEEKKEKKTKKTTKEKEIEEETKIEDTLEELEDDSDLDLNGVIDLDKGLLVKSKLKLTEKKETKKKKEDKKEDKNEFDDPEVVKVKKVDLNNVTNFIMELPAKQQNKKDLDIIKIPNYIKDLIPGFFEFPEKSITVNEGGIVSKERKINVEVVDCKNDIKYTQSTSKIFQRKGQTFISILCSDLEKIAYEENDIVRIIKLSTDIYHIEIVSKEMQEYKIWSKIMNKNLRASNRKYGIM